MSIYSQIREKLRSIPAVQRWVYFGSNLRQLCLSPLPGLVDRRMRMVPGAPSGVALCVRVKDEAPVLAEWLEYHLAAGISHFFVYESFSSDNFREVLQPFIDRGLLTLIADWPTVPVTPHAENDCILRSVNRFEWVGFLDVDEFLVLEDGAAIDDYLAEFPKAPAVGFHWRYFGSSGHRTHPEGPVILNYTRRAADLNRHAKVFVRPERVTGCRNPHSFTYRSLDFAVTEAGVPLKGSLEYSNKVRNGWVAHFHCKSEEEYIAKSSKKEACDRVGMQISRRSKKSFFAHLEQWNQVEDLSVQKYYRDRCIATGRQPVLLDR